MSRILAKQIAGIVDASSNQEVDGKKTFKKEVFFDKGTGSYDIVIQEGFLYWVQDRNQLDQEGNWRMGIVASMLVFQMYYYNQWMSYYPPQ